MQSFLNYFFASKAFQPIPVNIPEILLFVKKEPNCVNIIQVVNPAGFEKINLNTTEELKKRVSQFFQEKDRDSLHFLTIFSGISTEKLMKRCEGDCFCWFLDLNQKMLTVPEGKVSDFYGIRQSLAEALLHKEEIEQVAEAVLRKSHKRFVIKDILNLPYMNILLILLNVVIFLICTFTGDLLYNKGVLFGPYLFENGELYRFISCMFLHADVNHLTGNMLILYFMGEIAEKEEGHFLYPILYLLSGIGGGIASVCYEYLTGKMNGSIGASGAIFGITGVVLFLVISHRGKVSTITFPKILFLIVYSLYSGFTATNTDNAAHVGGLLAGFILAALVQLIFGKRKRDRKGISYEN